MQGREKAQCRQRLAGRLCPELGIMSQVIKPAIKNNMLEFYKSLIFKEKL